jgi:hypothetical protein
MCTLYGVYPKVIPIVLAAADWTKIPVSVVWAARKNEQLLLSPPEVAIY